MSLFRELQAAVREGLDELLNAGSSRDDVDHLTSLLESDLLEARSELDTAIEDERRLQSRMESEHRDAERLHEQAQAAVDRGDDEQGRELIRRRRRVLRGVEILETQRGEQRELIALLQDHLEALEDKLQEVQLRRDFLRSRQRVRSLRERYERYQREFGLDDLSPFEDELGSSAETTEDDAEDEPVVPREPLVPRSRSRLASEEHDERAPLARGGRAEVPPEPAVEPALREGADDEPEADWPRRRDLRLEREMLLRDIERRARSTEFDSEIEDELQRLKQATQPVAAPAATSPAASKDPDGPAPDA